MRSMVYFYLLVIKFSAQAKKQSVKKNKYFQTYFHFCKLTYKS